MVHSLYSDKDIFLRELISNASDALDKLRFEQLTKTELASAGEPADPARGRPRGPHALDLRQRHRDDARRGDRATSARSRSPAPASSSSALEEAQKDVPPELIGQFGVGFYSAFMVADRIVLVTRRAGADRRDALGVDRRRLVHDRRRPSAPHAGTTVTLHLKPEDAEHGIRDYTSDRVLARDREALLGLRRVPDQAAALARRGRGRRRRRAGARGRDAQLDEGDLGSPEERGHRGRVQASSIATSRTTGTIRCARSRSRWRARSRRTRCSTSRRRRRSICTAPR